MSDKDTIYNEELSAAHQRRYDQQVADRERQQRRLSQATAESKKLAEGSATSALGGVAAKASPTAVALQMAWRFYLPSFTLTSIYIVLHILLRYVFHFKSFCPADQGSPLAGVGGEVAGKAFSTVSGQAAPSGGGWMEKGWIALGIFSIAPLAAVVGLIIVLGDVVEHPWPYISCFGQGGFVKLTGGEFTDKFLSCVLAGRFQ